VVLIFLAIWDSVDQNTSRRTNRLRVGTVGGVPALLGVGRKAQPTSLIHLWVHIHTTILVSCLNGCTLLLQSVVEAFYNLLQLRLWKWVSARNPNQLSVMSPLQLRCHLSLPCCYSWMAFFCCRKYSRQDSILQSSPLHVLRKRTYLFRNFKPRTMPNLVPRAHVTLVKRNGKTSLSFPVPLDKSLRVFLLRWTRITWALGRDCTTPCWTRVNMNTSKIYEGKSGEARSRKPSQPG